MTTYRDRHLAGLYEAAGASTDKSKAQLQEALRALDQPVTGTKAELEARLAEAQAQA